MFKPENNFVSLLLVDIKRTLRDRKFKLDILDHPESKKGSKGTEYFRISVFDDVAKREINFDTFENKFSTTFITPLLIGVHLGLKLMELMERPMYNTKKKLRQVNELVTSQ